MEETNYKTLSAFNRELAKLTGGNSLSTKTSTIEHTNFVGEQETFIVQTIRDEEGDHIILKIIKGEVAQLAVLPPRVSSTLASHRDSLTTRRRSAVSKALAKQRKELGIKPNMAGLTKWRKKNARAKRGNEAAAAS